MQAHKRHKGTRFRYSSTRLDFRGTLVAWRHDELASARLFRLWGKKIAAANRIMQARKWAHALEVRQLNEQHYARESSRRVRA